MLTLKFKTQHYFQFYMFFYLLINCKFNLKVNLGYIIVKKTLIYEVKVNLLQKRVAIV